MAKGLPRSFRALQIASIVVPCIILVVWAWADWRSKTSQAEAHVQASVDLVRQYTQHIMSAQISLLRHVGSELADAAPQTPAEIEALHHRLARLADSFQTAGSLGVIAADGRLLASSVSFPVGARADNRDYFQVLREGTETDYIDRVVLRPAGQEAMVIAVRRPGDTFNGVMLAAIDISVFTDFFGQIVGDGRASASLLRADGMLLVRHTPEAPRAQLPADAPALRAIRASDAGMLQAHAMTDGVERLYAYAKVGSHPVYAFFGWPAAAIHEAWRDDMIVVALFLALISLLSVLGMRQTARSIIARQGRAQAQFDRRLLEEARRTARVRETLLRELHHRVKNNLQAIQSLIRMRLRGHVAHEQLDEIDRRIWAISQVHDLLYGSSELSSLDLGAFLKALCANPAIVPPERPITVRCRVEKVEIGLDIAVPLALVVVEILTNAVKHAFPDGRKGHVEVRLRAGKHNANLVVSDNGIGLGEPQTRKSGVALVDMLVQQIGGKLRVQVKDGTRYRVTVPLKRLAAGMAEDDGGDADAAAEAETEAETDADRPGKGGGAMEPGRAA